MKTKGEGRIGQDWSQKQASYGSLYPVLFVSCIFIHSLCRHRGDMGADRGWKILEIRLCSGSAGHRRMDRN